MRTWLSSWNRTIHTMYTHSTYKHTNIMLMQAWNHQPCCAMTAHIAARGPYIRHIAQLWLGCMARHKTA